MATRYGPWARLARARLSRRRALAGGAAALSAAGALAVVGCDTDDEAGPTPTAIPRRGGTLRTGTPLAISDGLDPHFERGSGLTIFPRVYGYAFHVDPRDDTLILDHAESIEQPDMRTYVVTLREGVRFHDVAPANGHEVRAQDYVASVRRYAEDPRVHDNVWHHTVFDSIEATDDRTAVVRVRDPNVYTVYELGGINSGAIVPEEVADARPSLIAEHVGSGPFVLEEMDAERGVRIARNAEYFRTELPHLDAMEWQVFDRDAERVAAFLDGELDVMPNRNKVEADRVSEEAPQAVVHGEPSLSSLALGLRTDRAPFSDERVREAIDIGLDREALVRDVTGGDGRILGPVNPNMSSGYWALPRAEVTQAYEPVRVLETRRARARAALGAAGVLDEPLRIQVVDDPEIIDVALAVEQQLRAIGLRAELQRVTLIEWFLAYRSGTFDATLIQHPPYETPDRPTRLYHSGGLSGERNPFRFEDAEIDRLVERSWAEFERPVRRRTLLEAQRLMLRARPVLPLFAGVGYTSAWPRVRGRRPEDPPSLQQYNHELWLEEE
jgi:peptide/nickel transport system substrate-binding protein